MKKEIVSLNSLEKTFKKEMSLEERFEILNLSSQNAIRGGNIEECPSQGGGDGCTSYNPCPTKSNCYTFSWTICIDMCHNGLPCPGIWTVPGCNINT